MRKSNADNQTEDTVNKQVYNKVYADCQAGGMNQTDSHEMATDHATREQQHTATPWIVNSCTRRGTLDSYRWLISNQEGRDADTIAALDELNPHKMLEGQATVAEANAKFIVKACNAHDSIVAALKMFVCIQHEGGRPLVHVGECTEGDEAIVSAARALALAGEKI